MADDPEENEEAAVTLGDPKVRAWRRERLWRLGFRGAVLDLLADDCDLDLAERLIAAGCDRDTAAQILY